MQGRVDVARNLKLLEGLKVQLLTVISELFAGLYTGAEERVLDALSAAVVILFSIANRAGISIRRLDLAVEEKLAERIKHPGNSLRDFELELLRYWQGKSGNQSGS